MNELLPTTDWTHVPRVTVIMPVRNEQAMVARSLGAVLAQNYPSNLVQILVVDGDSDDCTCQVIQTLPGAERVHIIENPRRLQAVGMNIGLTFATGDVIIRVDGHTIVTLDYLYECVRSLREHNAAVVGGGMLPAGTTATGRAIAVAGRSRFAVPSAFHVATSGRYTDTVYMGAWPRDILQRVGGYNEALSTNEDYELNWRIRQLGGRVYLDPAIRSTYFGRQTYSALSLQYFGYGKGKAAMMRRHPRSTRPRQLVAPAFVAVIATIPVVVLLPLQPLRAAWALALIAYIGCNATFSLFCAIHSELSLFWRIALAYVVLHLCWGTGFWLGLVLQAWAYIRHSARNLSVLTKPLVGAAQRTE